MTYMNKDVEAGFGLAGSQNTARDSSGYKAPALNNSLAGAGGKPLAGSNMNLGNFQKFGLAAQGIGAIAGVYNAYQQNKLQKKQFKASLADRNQNVRNQTTLINAELKNQAHSASQMSNNKVGSDAHKAAVANRTKLEQSDIAY
jgi:hypothetical protein